MTTGRAEEPGKSGPGAAVFIATVVAGLVAVRWLARQDWPVLAVIAAVLLQCDNAK